MVVDEGSVSDEDGCGGLNRTEKSCARLILRDTYVQVNDEMS